jgi:hypothetical protein
MPPYRSTGQAPQVRHDGKSAVYKQTLIKPILGKKGLFFWNLWHILKLLRFRLVSFGFVIPAPIFIGINSSRACPALNAGNPGASIFGLWIPVPRFREDKLHGNDSLSTEI